MNFNKAIEEIVNWLNGDKNYQLGISYLKSYSNNIATANSLAKFRNQEQLNKELWALLAELKIKRNASSKTITVSKEIIINTTPKTASTKIVDTGFEQMLVDYKNNIKLINHIKAQYVLLGDNLTEENKKRRHEMNFELLDLDFKSSELFFKIKYFEQYGIMPPIDTTDNKKLPKLDIQKKDETLRKGISKYKSKIQKAQQEIERNPSKDFTKELKKINEWEIKMNKAIKERNQLNNE